MTNSNKKQVKITKLWRKGAQLPEDCEELNEEIKQLEQKLKDKQMELFKLQRQRHKRKLAPRKAITSSLFIRPEKIIAQNNIEHLEQNMQLMSMLTGMMVKSYVAEDHCIVIYHMQHKSENAVQHGLHITMKSDQNSVSKMSMPLGFNFNAVVENYDNIMTAECLGSVRKALVAYYDRLEQFQALLQYLFSRGQLFKSLDSSYMEVRFRVCREPGEEEEEVEQSRELLLTLHYRVFDTRPKHCGLESHDLPEGEVDIIREQCAIFRRKPLKQAFKECFVKGEGPYKFVQNAKHPPASALPPRKKRARTQRYQHNHDATFRTEDCSGSESSGDESRHMDAYGRNIVC